MGLISYAKNQHAAKRLNADSKELISFFSLSTEQMVTKSIGYTAAKDLFRHLLNEFSTENLAGLIYALALIKNPKRSHLDLFMRTFVAVGATYELNMPGKARTKFEEYHRDIMHGSGIGLSGLMHGMRGGRLTSSGGDMSPVQASQLRSIMDDVLREAILNLTDSLTRFNSLKGTDGLNTLRDGIKSNDLGKYQMLITQMNSAGFRCDTFSLGKWFQMFFKS
jgi:hypothetical protein